MNKPDVKKIIVDVRNGISKRSPEILTGLGIAGMITTTILAVKATPKALKLLEDAQYDKGEELTAVEKVKVTWKPYIPAVVTGAISTGCLIGASSVSARRNAALATAYQLSTTALADYKEKVVETIGEKKEKTIHDKIAKDKVDDNPITKQEVYFTGKGETVCYDIHSGRYFKSDRAKITKAMNDLNYRMNSGMEMCISLNQFYDEIGLPQIPLGNEMGWRVDKGLMDIHFSAQLTEDDEPCMVIEHLVPPEYGFNKLY